MPNEPSTDGTFRVSYADMGIMTPEEIALLPRFDESEMQAALDNARAGTELWTQESSAGTEIVERTLAAFGSSLPLELRIAEGPERQAFRLRCYEVLRGYRDADPEERDRKLRRLIALPRMHMRRLVGSHSPRIRRRFASQQLLGQVCTQKPPEQQTDQRPRKERTATEHSDSCVRAAFKLACQGYIGRAASALVRPPPVEIDLTQKIADLTKLHPQGEEPTGVTLPLNPVHTLASVTISEVRASVRGCMNGSAAGADGWTFEALHDALEHDAFAYEFVAVIVDICNCDIAEDTRTLLASSWLVGIPKGTTAADGTRPIALGSVLLKVAATRSLASATKKLQERFRGSQFGCATKGGGEFIVHSVRRFLRTGVRPNGSVAGGRRVVITLDFANAFNSPQRQAMWEATKTFPELVGIFAVSYAMRSPLFIVGSNEMLWSERGARQGTVDGPVSFALTLQNVLNAANSSPDAQVLAYLDDVTILADSPEAAERIVADFAARAEVLGMLLKPTKCEVVTANEQTTWIDLPTLEPFRRARVVKLLGASIGMRDDTEEEHLLAREGDKAKVFMDRLRLGASPQLFTVLRQCGVPKLAYAVRVHAAAVSRRLCQLFDARVEEVIGNWASTPALTERQRLIIALPRTMGGLGLTRMELIAPAAYHASMSTALQGARRITNQAALASIIYQDVRERTCTHDPELRHFLDVHSLDGTDAGLSFTGARVHPDVFGALLRSAISADARTVIPGVRALPCHGCRRDYATGGAWGEHVSSCAVARGGHVTKRHNALASLIRRGLADAGFQPDATEPRDLAHYNCRCGLTSLPHETYIEHRKTCQSAGKQPLHVSGPDIRYSFDGNTWVADVTIVNLMTATHMQQTADSAFEVARQGKHARYDELCARAGVKFLPLPASANGHLGRELVALANIIADRTFRERLSVRREWSAAVCHGSAVGRLAAEESCGLRPATIALNQVRLAEGFRHQPLELPADADEPQSRTVAMPPLLPTPEPDLSLEDRITLGVSRALREHLDTLSVTWVSQARTVLDEESRARRAASEERRAQEGNEAAEVEEPSAAEPPIAEDTEAEEFRVRVAAETDRDAVERIILANRVAAEEQAASQRAKLLKASTALRRETDARAAQYAAISAHSNGLADIAHQQAEQLRRASSEATARAEAEANTVAALADQLERETAAASATMRAARDAAAAAQKRAHAQREELARVAEAAQRETEAARESRAQSECRAQFLVARTAEGVARIAETRTQEQLDFARAKLQRSREISQKQREDLAMARASPSVAPGDSFAAEMPPLAREHSYVPSHPHHHHAVISSPAPHAPHTASTPRASPSACPSSAPEPSPSISHCPVAPVAAPVSAADAAFDQAWATRAAVKRRRRQQERSLDLSPEQQPRERSSMAPMHNAAAHLGPPTSFESGSQNSSACSSRASSSAPAGPRSGLNTVSWLNNTTSQAVNNVVPSATASPYAKSTAPIAPAPACSVSSAASRRSAAPERVDDINDFKENNVGTY
jgi:hypothetical protein